MNWIPPLKMYTKKMRLTVLLGVMAIWSCSTYIPKEYASVKTLPGIFPDWYGVTVPSNIAPLNFKVLEEGKDYRICVKTQNGKSINLGSGSGLFKFPLKEWRTIMENSRGGICSVFVYVKKISGEWNVYKPITISVAEEPIDPFLVYRLIDPGYRYWSEMGIYQRNVTNFKERAIFTNSATGNGTCMNCHSFCKKDPDNMLFHVRGKLGGTVLREKGDFSKINTKTPYTMSAGVYPSWHPNGNLIAFSVNKIRQYFSSQPHTTIDVFDKTSDLIVYNIEKNMVTTSPRISTDLKENMPEWAPDGKFLYYCASEKGKVINETKYELMRIAYNATEGTWGEIDTVLSNTQFGKSISFPKISPDGRYIMFCGASYGYFTINYPESDLYVYDLKNGDYTRLDCNSTSVESYHSWSSNSRWFVFSSKRDDGLSTRLYLCYIDEQGRTHKPFLLPQKDPEFNNLRYRSYNVPELVSRPIKVSYHALKRVVYSDAEPVRFDPDVDIDALAGASRIKGK